MKNLYLTARGRWMLATASAAIITIVACNKNDDKPAEQQLAITSFSPVEAAEGATVVIKGTAFSRDKTLNTVKFNGLAATVSSAATNGTELSVTVPEDATTGKITVTVGDKTVTSATDFKVNPTAPVITTIAPEKGDIGTEVTITGNRYTNTSEVYFGGVKATEVTFVGKTSLKAKVPTGALNGKVKVTAATLEALSAADFWVKPAITSLSTDKAIEDAVIEINGTNFSTVKAENTVYFGTKAATEITEATATKLKVKVPAGAENDFIKVVVKEQQAVSAAKFTLLPTLISFAPAAVERGRPLTITGKNIQYAEVWLNGKRLNEYDHTATSIGLTIPNDAESGKLVIKQSGVDQEFATELRVVNYWRQHDMRNAPVEYHESRNFVYNKKIYCAFGYDQNSTYNTQVNSYDPLTKEWKHEFDIPSKVPTRTKHFSVVKGDKWYFGLGAEGDRRNCWVMDLTKTDANAFTPMTSFTTGGYYVRAFVLNNEVYVAVSTYENKVFRLNPTANSGAGSWDPVITAMNMPGGFVSNAFTVDNIAYIKDNAGNLFAFDPAGPSFIRKASVPSNTPWDPSMFALNGKGYYGYGGTLYEYSPSEDKWTPKGGLLTNDLDIHVIDNRVWGISSSGNVYEYMYQ